MDEKPADEGAPVTIKKYANRRLYNTATSSYVTLDHLCQMVKEGTEFVVYDAKTGENITRSVLTQIIVEEEAKGQNLLPIGFLRQLIRFYGDSLQAFLPRYLEISMETFARNQDQMRRYMEEAFGGLFPFGRFEELGRQNLAWIQRAFSLFAPPGTGGDGRDVEASSVSQEAEDPIDQLKDKLNAMQKQLDELARKDRQAD